jgi:hypothetical protein
MHIVRSASTPAALLGWHRPGGLGDNTGEEAVIRERLLRIIDILCEDAARIELWACALNGFAQAVPDYSDPFANPVRSRNETVDKDAEQPNDGERRTGRNAHLLRPQVVVPRGI